MSTIDCRKYARQTDCDFVVAAARAFYCEWYLSDDRREASVSGPGVELTDVIPETERWAFAMARQFAEEFERRNRDNIGHDEAIAYTSFWLGQSDEFKRHQTNNNSELEAGWYAAMQAMGHGVGLADYGIDDVDCGHVEVYP